MLIQAIFVKKKYAIIFFKKIQRAVLFEAANNILKGNLICMPFHYNFHLKKNSLMEDLFDLAYVKLNKAIPLRQ